MAKETPVDRFPKQSKHFRDCCKKLLEPLLLTCPRGCPVAGVADFGPRLFAAQRQV